VAMTSGDGVVEQLRLFERDVPAQGRAFSAREAANLTGISYRQLDYWARSGVLRPSVLAGIGSGSPRAFDFTDLVVLSAAARMIGAGLALSTARTTVGALRAIHPDRLAELTVVCDGTRVREVNDDDDVARAVDSGNGVVTIALSRIWASVATRVHDETTPRVDELTQRRLLKAM